MTSKLRCPFCKEEIISDVCCMFNKKNKDYTSGTQIYKCNKCGLFGNKELWQALTQSLKDRKELAIKLAQTAQNLEQSEKCCSAWETQALDYKAETIALSGKLEIATKALKEIDTTRCIPQQTLISLGKLSKTTRFNAGNIICVATPDHIHNTLEQIKHKEK